MIPTPRCPVRRSPPASLPALAPCSTSVPASVRACRASHTPWCSPWPRPKDEEQMRQVADHATRLGVHLVSHVPWSREYEEGWKNHGGLTCSFTLACSCRTGNTRYPSQHSVP